MTECIFITLPTYNRGEKCTKVIQNILDQSLPNWHLLIVNDGSETHHGQIIQDFLHSISDNRVEYHENETNLKFPSSINVGIKEFLQSDCKYFTWISDDNIYYPNYLQNLYDLKADFAHSAWQVNGHLRQTEYKNYYEMRHKFKGLASFMWSRQAIDTIGLYNTEYQLASDLEYLFRTYSQVSDIKYSDRSGMNYIIHQEADSVRYSQQLAKEDQKLRATFPP